LIVINAVDQAQARAARIVPPEHVVLTPGIGMDLDHYRPTEELLDAAAGVREELGLAPQQVLFSVISALQPGKGHLDVVRAVAALDDLDAVVVCAGRGPMRDAILQEAARLGVTDRIVLAGSVRDVRPLVLASRATILASRREGLSRAVLESLGLGVPVIGTRIRGIADVVEWPGAGVLVEPGDVPGLVSAMHEVLGFPEPLALRAELEPRLKEFGVDALLALHADLYDDLYDELLSRRRPSRSPSR
jgi:glycosyltransferase involved in cell wall biosynthesis